MTLTFTHQPTTYPLNNSEDYYGDLDLKSIRKSELLAGLANADSRAPHKKKNNTN